MYLQSQFPDPPPVHDINAHNLFFGRPDQSEWPDYNIHIDIETDRRRTFKELEGRVKDALAAFASPLKGGGVEFGGEGTGEMVGIMSENSSVCLIDARVEVYSQSS
jgi:hypothetical protein